jgi:inhibitor of KinA sporulation pathway (predicted exonuclease)
MYDYYLILDFEATCDEEKGWINEIIEFPIVALESSSGEIVADFREFVKPVKNPILTPFCTELTGITQEQVSSADTFPFVFARAIQWVETFFKEHSDNCIFVTCGDWDLQRMLPSQVRISRSLEEKDISLDMRIPEFFSSWVNIKFPFRDNITGENKTGMTQMLTALHLPLLGRHHSGLDDSRNIAAIARELLKRNIDLTETTRWSQRLQKEFL